MNDLLLIGYHVHVHVIINDCLSLTNHIDYMYNIGVA